MDNNIIAALVVTFVAVSAMYLWLAAVEAIQGYLTYRRWRNARRSASIHFNFQPETTDINKGETQ